MIDGRPLRRRVAIVLVASGMLIAGIPRSLAMRSATVPVDDATIVETLPVDRYWSEEARTLRDALASNPRDEVRAVEMARWYLDIAQAQGDARYAGYALGALRPWEATPAATPVEVMVMRAAVLHDLRDLDGAEVLLRRALALQPDHAQGWLMLATLLRMRGRYDESDSACRSVGRDGLAVFSLACQAANTALRGDAAVARFVLHDLLLSPKLTPSARQWLWSDMAEVEELAGRRAEAEAAYRESLAIEGPPYVTMAFCDFLLREGRRAEVQALLASEPRSNAVLLRLAIASRGGEEADELLARFKLAALRPGAQKTQAREKAMLALDVTGDPMRALELARVDIKLQREPIDLLIYARAAASTGDQAAIQDVKALLNRIGIRDARIDAVL